MLAWCMSTCLSVYLSICSSCHKPVLYRNDWTNSAGFSHGGFLPPTSYCYKEIWVPPRIRAVRVLLSGILSQTLDSQDFAVASRLCCQQNSSTVELIDDSYMIVDEL